MPQAGRYAQVIVDIAASQTDRVYTYRVPDGMAVLPGTRVSVPFGNRALEGYVLALTDEAGLAPERIKDLGGTLEDYPALLPELMALAQEISRERHCPLALALRLMLPAEMRAGRVRVKTELAARLLISPGEAAEAVKGQSRAPKRKLLLQLLSDGQIHPVSELRLLARNPLPALRALEEQGLVKLSDQEVLRQPFADVTVQEPEPELTPGQREALGEILPAIERGSGAFLLHGVTGSGKTEVYIRAVKACLKRGKAPSC